MGSGLDHDRRTWWFVFVSFFVAAATWALATPLMTGPDEGSQIRRAAAAARGQWNGVPRDVDPPIFVDVMVPVLYGEITDLQGRCFLGPTLDRSPQEPWIPHEFLAADCPELTSDPTLVEAPTNQGRGQPFFYVLAGLPTRWNTGPAGAHGARLVVSAITAGLVASTACSVRSSRRPVLAGLALFSCLTPVVVYLAGSTNPASIEIAAAAGAWAAGAVLASGVEPGRQDRLIVRFGTALAILVVCRGLSPAFAAIIVASLAWIAGWPRCLDLMRRRSTQVMGVIVAVASLASVAWLVHNRSVFPPPERAGRGWLAAARDLTWYLHQCIGVFGNNEAELPIALSGLWVLLVLAIVAAGVLACLRSPVGGRRPAVVSIAALVGGVVLCVTAEGLDLPPIGFFWQGRYALPLIVGGLLVAACSAGAEPRNPHPSLRWAASAAVAAMVVVHLVGFSVVVRHHGGLGGGSVGLVDALVNTAWDPPVPIWAAFATYAVAITALGLLLTTRRSDPPSAPGDDGAERRTDDRSDPLMVP